jgi:pimeloyl-ACP methyl ester carboxylesterase
VISINKKIDNLNINYIEKGEGRVTLIVPGWGTTIDTYMTLINSISTYSKVYCLDMPGFGKSEEPKEAWDVDKYIDFIIKFIESENIKELDLIGHSNGGRIIIKMMSTKKLNFSVSKIILIGSAGIVHKKSFSQRARVKVFKGCKKILNLKPIKKIFPNALTKLQNSFGSEDYRNASPVMKTTLVKLVNEDLKENLPNVKVPTLLLWGENDTATPIEDGKLMEKLIPDAGLVKFENCSHYVFLERVAHVNAIIENFLRGGK